MFEKQTINDQSFCDWWYVYNRPSMDICEFYELVSYPDCEDHEVADFDKRGFDWPKQNSYIKKCYMCLTVDACCIEDCKFTVSENGYYGEDRDFVLCPGAWCHACMMIYADHLYCNSCESLRPWVHHYNVSIDHCICPEESEECVYCEDNPWIPDDENSDEDPEDDSDQEEDEDQEESDDSRTSDEVRDLLGIIE